MESYCWINSSFSETAGTPLPMPAKTRGSVAIAGDGTGNGKSISALDGRRR